MLCSVKDAFFKSSNIINNTPNNIPNKYNSQIDYFSETRKIKENSDPNEKLIKNIAESLVHNMKMNPERNDKFAKSLIDSLTNEPYRTDPNEKLIRTIVDSINTNNSNKNTDDYRYLYNTVSDLKHKNELLELSLRMNNPNKYVDCQSFTNHIEICNICKTYVENKYNKNNLDITNLFSERKIFTIILYIGLIVIGIKLVGQIGK